MCGRIAQKTQRGITVNRTEHINPKLLFTYLAISVALLVITVFGLRPGTGVAGDVPQSGDSSTVVLAGKTDPYYSLAKKIADEEHTVIVSELDELDTHNPTYVIAVYAPENLTERWLYTLGSHFQKTNTYPALGIITGQSPEKAEQLWERRLSVKAEKSYMASDVERNMGVDQPILVDVSKENQPNSYALNKQALVAALEVADYFHWVRHVSHTRWHWNSEQGDVTDNDVLAAKDVPDLKPAVIYVPSCGSMQLSKPDSIAMAFIEKGAAAYIGNLYSPMSGAYDMRHASYLPARNTWPDFPIGVVAQIQNRMMTRAVYNTPQFFMVGDPRISFLGAAPYTINSDIVTDKRRIEGASDIVGIVPLKIEGGASYAFLSIKGLGASSELDCFYNNDIQTLNLGQDKYVLFVHNGGTFQIELDKNASMLWTLGDAIKDSFDQSWIVIGVVYGELSIGMLALFLAILLFKIWRRNKTITEYLTIFGLGVMLAAVQVAYLFAQMDYYSVSAYVVDYSLPQILLGFIGVFSSTAGGLMLMKDAKSLSVRILGVLVAVLPQLLFTGLYFGVVTFTNLIYKFANPVSIFLWNYATVGMPAIVLLVEIVIVLLSFNFFVTKRDSIQKKMKSF
jgi:hypothetical protein